jgi:hypothetical protein
VATGYWIMTLDTYTAPGYGSDTTQYTRLRAPYVNPEGFLFTLYRRGLFSGLGKLMGMQDIEVGHPFFDDTYIIKSNSEDRIRKFCQNECIRELMDAQPLIHLQIHDDEGRFKVQFPDGVDELRFNCVGVIKDIDHLKGLFELFAEALHQLCHDGEAYEDDIDIHIRRLEGPGGTIEGDHLLWEGDPARCDSAAALGRLKAPKAVGALLSALWSEDTVLRAHAVNALASIGHSDAIGPLIRLLGDTSPAAGKRRVRDALRGIGEGQLVDVVLAALVGDAPRIKGAVGAYRGEVIDAFVNALEGASGTSNTRSRNTAIHAAKALEDLHATEALPWMREALRRTGTRNRAGQAIEASIQALEARAALPRPAQGREVGADTLPRAADEPGPATDTLPRAVEEDT